MAVQEVKQQQFEQVVLKAAQPVLVDFWASWCGPCQMMGPVVEAVSDEVSGLTVCKVNTDENIDLALQLKIDSIPCLIAFEGGQEVARLVGYRPKEALKAWLEECGLA